MTERSSTRRELEEAVRALLPDEITSKMKVSSEPPTVAAVGLGGLFTGYVWGWVRGHRSRSRKRKA